MATSFYRKSAEIYQFPARPARKVEERRGEASAKADLTTSDVCEAADGCWYHEEAVRAETSTTH
ncbi:DUF2735 domain-containing protein [Sinorhizobium numidicum]|uniref:DUF2735 domain-containing protein n=1 Tax=Sinorhizobium numidicum TaxID=680248 RepID=A0ABY8CNC8_9HYPH|nr:DUF2735 domain-containing protein [Sinorhizobium numidicum]WEX74179.1 DUF2735 domain-containing protein [Sinorhizobium numidicum]WEX80164.1 DUF2735 domain-containing protein [Sinorhizobium numidicum]